ncbi:MAG: ABC transporter substrate-binding protein, partial [Gammaproteobacteria bacterium]
DQDCMNLFRQRVTEAGLLEPAQLDEVDAEIKTQIQAAVAGAKSAQPPTAADLLSDVYVSY